MHRATVRFWSLFERLPASAQKAARKNFDLLKTDPAYPSLHFKKVGNLWSARIGSNYRALAMEDEGDFIWIWIGPHDEYERLVRE
jgi:hypothetical protein